MYGGETGIRTLEAAANRLLDFESSALVQLGHLSALAYIVNAACLCPPSRVRLLNGHLALQAASETSVP